MKAEEIREIIVDSAFAWKVEELMAATRPAIRLRSQRVEMDSLAPGVSRFGGLPDLPKDMPWPSNEENEDRPLEFLAQINFEEAARVTGLPSLPKSGWLVVFYDIEMQGYGFPLWKGQFFEEAANRLQRLEPGDKEARGCRLLNDDPRGDRPPPRGQDFHACTLDMTPWTCPPDEAAFLTAGIDGSSNPRGHYGRLRKRLTPPEHQPCHLLGGLPMPIQNDPRESPDWQLLLQIDSDEAYGPGWSWGDGGRMYLLATEKGLADRDFGQAQASWDCY